MDDLIYLLVIYLVLHTGGASITSQMPFIFPSPVWGSPWQPMVPGSWKGGGVVRI